MKGESQLLSTSAFIQAMIPLYIMVIIGFSVRKMNILNRHANHVITQLLLYITLPALILYSLNKKITKEILMEFAWLVVMSIFILSISVLLAAWLRRKADLLDNQKSVYESLIIFGNQGFIGFAIIYILMEEQGVIYVTLFNICYLILIWTYGIYLFTKKNGSNNWRLLVLNPGILSTLVGLMMFCIPYHWPKIFLNTFEVVGKMTIPLSMILIGSLLAEIEWKSLQMYSKNKYIWIAATCKLFIFPLFLLLFFLFKAPYPLIIIAVLTSAMPSASTTSIYAQKFEADANFASFGVLLTTLLCIITIPSLYFLLQWLHNLVYLSH